MSKLDYITIAIVAACIMAIIFLVYKMTDVFSNDKPAEKIENVSDQVEEETDDGMIDYGDLDENTGNTGGNTVTDNVGTTGESATNPNVTTTEAQEGYTGNDDTEEDEVPAEKASNNTPSSFNNTPSGKSSGKHLVIAGTFSVKANGEKQLRKLKSLGYANASLETFDRGKYVVLLVDRFDDESKAQRLVKDLKAEGVESYVKTN